MADLTEAGREPMAPGGRTGWLTAENGDDAAVMAEIEWFSELVIAASQSEDPLTFGQIDSVLGIRSGAEPAPPRPRQGGSGSMGRRTQR